jgi:hypothetical protein
MNRTWCMDAFHIHHLSITSTWAKFHYLPDIFIFYKTIINASFLNVFSTLKNLNLNKKNFEKKNLTTYYLICLNFSHYNDERIEV